MCRVILHQTYGQVLLGADLEVLLNKTVRTSNIHAAMWDAKKICREVAETGLWQFIEYSTPRDRDVDRNQTSFLLTSWKQADFQVAGYQVEVRIMDPATRRLRILDYTLNSVSSL